VDEKLRQQWAQFRFAAIAPLVCRRLDEAQRREEKRKILQTAFTTPLGEQRQVADRTLRTWITRYNLYGYEGLLRMESRTRGKCEAIPEDVLDAAEELRLELRSRSIRGILAVLRTKGLDVSKISPSTLNFHLNRRGATKEKLASEKGTFQLFQKDHANDMWQADCSGGLYLPDPYNKGQHKQVHLISMIDDATRVATHAAFYWDEQLPSLFDCFRKALLKRGRVSQIYTDNGPCFKSRAFARTCAQLGIELLHSEPHTPEGRGKIEKHIGTIKGGFYDEAKHSGLQTLDDLNEFFFAWLEKEYHHHKHKSLAMTPFERWRQDEEKGLVHLVTPEDIRHALMIEEDRTVGKRTALIQLTNRLYQASRELAGKKVQVRFEADRRNPTIEVWFDGKLVEVAKEIVPGSNIDYSRRPQRQRQPEKLPKVLHSSKHYRQSLVSEYRKQTQPVQAQPGDYLSEPEFQTLVARVLDRVLDPEELSYLAIAFAELSPLKDAPTETVLQKASAAKGKEMHLRYYCDLLLQARLLERR
jgi:putative transposase